MPFRITTLAVWACFGAWTAIASAQARTSATGGTQQTTSQGSSATGSSATGLGTSAGGTSASGGSGGTAAQMSTGNQPTFNTGDGSVGAQVGQNGFTGRTNTGFAGSRNATQNSGTSLTPQFIQLDDSANQSKQGNTNKNNIKRARPQQRIAFTYPKANLAATRIQLGERFKRLSGVSGVDTAISDEGVATLTGMVTSDDSRKLAEALTRLEPGVRSVVNELKVSSSAP